MRPYAPADRAALALADRTSGVASPGGGGWASVGSALPGGGWAGTRLGGGRSGVALLGRGYVSSRPGLLRAAFPGGGASHARPGGRCSRARPGGRASRTGRGDRASRTHRGSGRSHVRPGGQTFSGHSRMRPGGWTFHACPASRASRARRGSGASCLAPSGGCCPWFRRRRFGLCSNRHQWRSCR